MAITELSDNELLVPHVPALRRDLMLEGDVTGHPVHPRATSFVSGRTAFGDLQPRRRIGRGSGVARQWMVWSCRDAGVARCPDATVGGLMRHDWSWFRVPVVGWPPSLLSWKSWTWSMPVRRPSCRCRPLAGSPPGSGPVGPPWSSAGDGPVRSHTLMCAPSDGGNRNR